MNTLKRILLFVSSFIPLYLLIFIKVMIDISQGNLSFNRTNTTLLVLCALLFLLGLCGFFLVSHSKNNIERVTLLNFKNTTQESYLGFFSLFVLFAVSFEIEYISMFVVYCMVIVMVGVVYIKNNLFYINPFLNIIGYSCFEVEVLYKDKTTRTIKVFSKCNLKCSNSYKLCGNLFIKNY